MKRKQKSQYIAAYTIYMIKTRRRLPRGGSRVRLTRRTLLAHTSVSSLSPSIAVKKNASHLLRASRHIVFSALCSAPRQPPPPTVGGDVPSTHLPSWSPSPPFLTTPALAPTADPSLPGSGGTSAAHELVADGSAPTKLPVAGSSPTPPLVPTLAQPLHHPGGRCRRRPPFRPHSTTTVGLAAAPGSPFRSNSYRNPPTSKP
jgi:hypothetical protein